MSAPLATDRVAVVGSGMVGSRVIKRLVQRGHRVIAVDTRDRDPVRSSIFEEVTLAVLTQPGAHHPTACALLDRGIHVVSVGDHVVDVKRLLGEGERARSNDCTLVPAAGMSSGLTALLARHLSREFQAVDEIHIAVHGTAGPACARQHHRALAGTSTAYIDGAFEQSRAGSGRELVWFPEPVSSYDCYRAELPTAIVVQRAFDDVRRITARMSANRRDRLTSRLPMLAPPHREGGVGAVRVELRGAAPDGSRHTVIAGIAEMVGTAAGGTAAAFADMVQAGHLPRGLVVPGDAEIDTLEMLHLISSFGVRLQSFTGEPTA